MKTLLCFLYFSLYYSPMCASTTLHAFILIPCSCQHTPPEHDGGELPGSTEKFPNSLFPRIQGVRCLLDSYLSQAWSDVWVVVDVKLYNLFHQVWSGMKPWFTKLSLSYAALQKTSSFTCTWRSGKQAGGIFSPAVVAQKLPHLPEM